MRISSISCALKNITSPRNINNKNNSVKNNFEQKSDVFVSSDKKTSFKGLYVDKDITLGRLCSGDFPSEFLSKDSLVLREIAALYPNQDCFIIKGKDGIPALTYREAPIDIMRFSDSLSGLYNISVEPVDNKYPAIPLILYPDLPEYQYKLPGINKMLGVTSRFSYNPSLPYTVKVGYDLHKRVMDKKSQIMGVVGENDYIDLGSRTVADKAHESIEDTETAVTRYLMEAAFKTLNDRDKGVEPDGTNYPKPENKLKRNRNKDLITSLEDRPQNVKNPYAVDICDDAERMYPNDEENQNQINMLYDYMLINHLYLYNAAIDKMDGRIRD